MIGRTMTMVGSVLLLIAGALGLIRDWGQPFQGSAPVWLLLMGFATLLLGLCLKRSYALRASKERCPECGEGIEKSPADGPQRG